MQVQSHVHSSWASIIFLCVRRLCGKRRSKMALCIEYRLLYSWRHKFHNAVESKIRRLLFVSMEIGILTSFHRPFEILSRPDMGSMKTSLTTLVSGTHIAHSKCTHPPSRVCLKAPPSFGHNRQSCQMSRLITKERDITRTTGFSGNTVHFLHNHWPSGI